MGLAGGKRSRGREGGGGTERPGEGETAVPTALISWPPHPVFSRASGYLLIGYSKISETRRYRRRKRGRRQRRRGTGGRGKEDERLRRRRGRARKERAQVGGLSRTVRARVGVNYHYPPKTRLSFCSPRVPFCFFPRCPTPPAHHQRASIPPLAFATRSRPPLILHLLPSPPLFLLVPTVHLKYEFDITFHPTALARPPPRTSSSVSSPPAPIPPSLPARHSRPTITGPRTI